MTAWELLKSVMSFECPFSENRNSFNGLSWKSSPYRMSVLQCNAFGASAVEVMTTVPLLSKEEQCGCPV